MKTTPGRPTRRSIPTYPSVEDGKRTIPRFEARVMDIVGSALAFLFLMPTFLAIACAVKATSKGPIFFRQRRIGQHGKSFVFLKFRSMFVNNDAAIHTRLRAKTNCRQGGKNRLRTEAGKGFYKLTRDPRITKVGSFLRKTSLDELPQFINVLMGEMSLVRAAPSSPLRSRSL